MVVSRPIGRFFDETGIAIAAGFKKGFGKRTACSNPPRGELNIVGISEVIVAIFIAGVPEEFEASSSDRFASQAVREPSELSMVGEVRASHLLKRRPKVASIDPVALQSEQPVSAAN